MLASTSARILRRAAQVAGRTRLALACGYATLPGPRPVNEDFVGMVLPEAAELASKGMLIAVADGVSGNGGGREASEYTVRSLLSDYYATPDHWETPVAIDRVLNAANRWLLAQSAAHPEREGMATTLSALVLKGRRYVFAHIGDTRIYLLRAGKLTRLTSDHVWARPEMQHVLTRAIGLDTHLALDYGEGDLQPGDRFLLASDGLWQPLGEPILESTLEESSDATERAQRLCEAALANGSQDNVTAAIVEVLNLPEADLADSAEQVRSLDPPPRLRIGDTVDAFEVLASLHESRITLVYLVRDTAGGNRYAMKTLTREAATDADEREAFTHEEWLARRVVVRFFPQYVSVAPERRTYLYYLMTWHEGADLQQKLDAGAHFNVPEAIQHATKLARAAAALHRRLILHRDIKPANVHLGADGELRLLDLGVAVFGEEAAKPRRRAQAGTPSYIAPEQYTGATPSPQVDLYAIGVTLYHLLTRRYPYGEIEPFQRPKFGNPVPPTRYRPDIPPWFENLILKAVAHDPAERFETADELLVALEHGPQRPIGAPPPRPLAQRDPVALWRAVAIISVSISLLLLYLLIAR